MIKTLTGNNHFLLKQRLAELADEFVKENGDLALERFDGSEAEPGTLIEAVQSLPLLAERKMVIITDLSQNKPAIDQIEQIISSISESTDIVFYEHQIDRRSSYFKVLKSQTELEEYSRLDGAALSRWVVDEAKKQGAKLAPADAQLLVRRTGENQLLIKNELDKLITHDPEIDRNSIELLVEETPQSRVFDLLDSAFAGQKQRALKLYGDQRAQKVEPQIILAMISRQLWLISLAASSEGRGAREIASDAGLNSAYPAEKAAQLARRLSLARLSRLTEQLYEIDRQAKTKSIDLDEALKNYLLSI